LAIPLIISQIYIENKNANLTEVKNVSDINLNKTTELYSIQYAFADKENYRMWTERSFKGKYQQEIVITSYFICPLVDSSNYPVSRMKNNLVWIGVSFSEDFSNRVFENEEKQNKAIGNFIRSTPELYKNHRFQTNYLRNLIRNDDFNSYFYPLKRQFPKMNKNDVLILKEINTAVEDRASDNVKWFFRAFMGGNLIWLIFIGFAAMNKNELTKFNKKQKEPFSWKYFTQDIVWVKAFRGTLVLVSINLIVYIILYFSDINFNNSYELLKW